MKARTIITLEPEQTLLLKHLAAADQISVSGLIRKAVDLLLKEEKGNSAQLILKSADEIAKSYPPDFKIEKNLSQKVDQIVYE